MRSNYTGQNPTLHNGIAVVFALLQRANKSVCPAATQISHRCPTVHAERNHKPRGDRMTTCQALQQCQEEGKRGSVTDTQQARIAASAN